MFAFLLPVYGEYTLRLLNALRFRISYMRLFAIASHNSLRSDRCSTTAASMYEIYGSFAEFRKRSVYSTWTEQIKTAIQYRNHFNLLAIPARINISSASPQPGRPRPTAVAGRENPPGVWWHHKDDTGMREEELIVYIYLKNYNKVENILL